MDVNLNPLCMLYMYTCNNNVYPLYALMYLTWTLHTCTGLHYIYIYIIYNYNYNKVQGAWVGLCPHGC